MTNNFERIDLIGTPDRSSLMAEKNTVSFQIQKFLRPATVQAVGYPVVGIDVSSWQGRIDWGKAAERIHFAFIRAGVGSSTIDQNSKSIEKNVRNVVSLMVSTGNETR